MTKYCEKCRTFHDINDICPKYKMQLKKHPEWLAECADFAVVAGEYRLISGQALDGLCQTVNKIAGTDLAYEGTQRVARDIQVFSKLNSDAFRNTGQFADAQAAKETVANASDGFLRYLKARLNGTGEEIDWLRSQQGKISGIFNKYSLPNGNTVGYDGETVNRLTGKIIQRTSIKSAEASSGLYTNAKDIVEALEKGTLAPDNTVTGVKGIKDSVMKALDRRIEQEASNGNNNLVRTLEQAKNKLKISELGSTDSVKESTTRLMGKLKNGFADTTVTSDMVIQKALQGAVIGAAVGLSVSCLISFIRYKNGELSREEAFREIGEDSVKGAITGAALGGVTLFLPGGAIGFAAGVAIGIYIDRLSKNVLDEIFGKGAFEQILHACGYVAGTAKNVAEMLKQYGESVIAIDKSNRQSTGALKRISDTEKSNDKALKKLNVILEDL